MDERFLAHGFAAREVARTKMNVMLRVGEALRFRLVAECVEDQDLLLALKAMGVPYAQTLAV
jgi:EAL domain-containing protein (putative c-di-GMP-specific phosphodiesterase class I)